MMNDLSIAVEDILAIFERRFGEVVASYEKTLSTYECAVKKLNDRIKELESLLKEDVKHA